MALLACNTRVQLAAHTDTTAPCQPGKVPGPSGPARVRLQPSCLFGGAQAIQAFQHKTGDLGNVIERQWQVPECHEVQPVAVPPLVGPAAGRALVDVDPVAVLNALSALDYDKEYKIPMDIATLLKGLLPTEGLLPFLKAYPRFFDVTLNQENSPSCTFKVIRKIQQNSPVGGQGPAVGGQGGSSLYLDGACKNGDVP